MNIYFFKCGTKEIYRYFENDEKAIRVFLRWILIYWNTYRNKYPYSMSYAINNSLTVPCFVQKNKLNAGVIPLNGWETISI